MNGRIQRNEPAATMVLPRIGKIKIGKKSEKGYPMSVDYFIPSGKYAGLFTQAYGENRKQSKLFFRAMMRKKCATNIMSTGTMRGGCWQKAMAQHSKCGTVRNTLN